MPADQDLRLTESGIIHAPHSGELATTLTHVDYQLAGAVAELIDNSIDAKATNIIIRIVRTSGYPNRLLVIDNGNGIAEDDFNSAMTWAERREYDSQDTGMFGVGMKSASLALCNSLTVISKATNDQTSGRRWTRESTSREELFEIRQLDCELFLKEISSTVPSNLLISGTTVCWDEIDEFDVAQASRTPAGPFLERIVVSLEQSLGLIFHRFIDRGDLTLEIDIQDSESSEIYGLREVESINPFGYTKSGRKGYPKELSLKGKEMAGITLKAHIWPKGMKTINFKIPKPTGTGAAESQGLYIYRSDRLLMAGTWAGVSPFEAHKSLARMEINLPSNPPLGVKVNFHKTAVTFQPSIVQMIKSSRSSDGTSFEQWIEDAIEVQRTQDTNKKVPIELPLPTNALPVEVRRAFKENSTGGKALAIEWGRVARGKAFRISSEKLIINQEFKIAFKSGESNGNRGSSLPLTLLVLVLRDIAGKKRTAKQKAIEEAIQNIIYTAMTENS